MRYMKWTPHYEPGQREAPVEIFDVIRASGGFVDALHTTPEQEILCVISDDVDLSSLDAKWQAAEVSEKRLLNLLRARDPQVFLRPDGTPVYPTEILANEIPTVPVDYI
jgi:hypothetical protein